MRPRIGITSGTGSMPVPEGTLPSHYIGRGYTRSVDEVGGLPIVLPAVEGREEADAAEMIELLDGLLLAGGTDIDPTTYGHEPDPRWTQKPDRARDRFEAALVREARKRDLPILGVCRGFQMLNVAYGGTLAQHRPHESSALADVPELRVEKTRIAMEAGTRTAAIYEVDALDVFCIHHQAIEDVGEGLRVTARASDGLIEGLEDPEARFVVGVLWHPEQMGHASDALRVYEALVHSAKEVAA